MRTGMEENNEKSIGGISEDTKEDAVSSEGGSK